MAAHHDPLPAHSAALASSLGDSLRRMRELPLAVLVAAYAMAYWLAPTSNGTVTCLLRLHADQACPGCGMSRATGRLVRGDVIGSYAYHPMAIVLAIQAVAVAVWRIRWGRRPITDRHHLLLAWGAAANVGLLLLVWLARTATGHLANVY